MNEQFRFVDSANGTVGGRRYVVQGEDGEVLWSCETTGPALNEVIGFHGRDGGEEFTLVPKRRLANRSFTLHEGGPEGAVLFTMSTHHIGCEWKAFSPEGSERFRIVDPTGKLEAALRFLFEGFTDQYAVLADGRIVGRVGRRSRPESDDLPGGVRGLLRRAFRASDWVLELEDKTVDRRAGVAAVLLLLQLQIRGRGGMT